MTITMVEFHFITIVLLVYGLYKFIIALKAEKAYCKKLKTKLQHLHRHNHIAIFWLSGSSMILYLTMSIINHFSTTDTIKLYTEIGIHIASICILFSLIWSIEHFSDEEGGKFKY